MAGILDEFVTVLGLEIKDDGLAGFRSDIGSTIGKLGLLVAGAVSAAASISALLNTASDVNATSKFARSIDESFEAVQRLDFAAKKTGVSGGGLQSLLSSMRSAALAAKLGDNDGFLTALGGLGLTPFEDGTNQIKSMIELFKEMSDAVRNAPDEDIALGFAQNAGAGQEFTELLRKGRAGIDALERQAQASGAILSQEAARVAEDFRDSVNALNIVVKSLFFEQGKGIVELLTRASEGLLEFSRSDELGKIKDGFSAIAGEIERIIRLNAEFIESLKEELPDGALKEGLITGGVGFLLRRNPVAVTAAIVAAGNADVQGALKGEEGTVSAPILEFMKRAGEASVRSQELQNSGQRAVRQTIAPFIQQPFSLTPGSERPVNIEINNENNFQSGTDIREAGRLVDEFGADAIREAGRNLDSPLNK